jgi:serine/threonine protein kinase/Tfp pilus assembly protein PilF
MSDGSVPPERPDSSDPRDQRDATPDTSGELGSTAPAGESPATRAKVGIYELVEIIGVGAFGQVFRAWQTGPIQRTVALKLLREGRDSNEVLARFNAERQALAMMDHPSIAAVYDAGTSSDGRPYFAMEFIRGEPITAYCDKDRLDIHERLALFGQLCSAVQHAHHKGVIHRDLKPSNVLVTEIDGQPIVKIIDFGIAKALGSTILGFKTLTELGQVVGTPAYMSPEQAQGDNQRVDTRTDIYSLGVLLYELISGSLPYGEDQIKQAGIDGWRKLLIEVDPPRPSERLRSSDPTTLSHTSEIAAKRRQTPRTLLRQLAGDLDWIVMRCLEKESNRRYPTASELIADIQRFLADEPVSAGPPTMVYRLRKLIRRRRGALLATAAVGVTALVGLVISTVLLTKTIDQQRRLDRLRVDELIAEARQYSYFNKSIARERLDEAARLAPDHPDVPRERAVISARWKQFDEAKSELRRYLDWRPDDGLALSYLAGLIASESPAEAESLRQRARGRLDEATRLFAEALTTEDDAKSVALFTQSLQLFDWNADAVWQRGVRLIELRKFEAALADANLLARVRPGSAIAHALRGTALNGLQQYELAAPEFDRALELAPELWVNHYNRCWINFRLGRLDAAKEDARRLAAEQRELPADVHELFGWIYRAAEEYDRSLIELTRVIELGDRRSTIYHLRGDVHARLGHFDNAVADFDQALQLDAKNVEVRLSRAAAQRQLGRLDLALEDYAAACTLEPENAKTNASLGRALQLAGQPEQALKYLERATQLEPLGKVWWAELGANHWMNGRRAQTRVALEKALGERDTVWVRVWLWELLMLDGQPQAAQRMIEAASTEHDTPLVREAVRILSTRELPESPPAFVKRVDDKLYWHFTLATEAFVRGDRTRAQQEYLAITQLGDVANTEVDIASWKLRQF